MSQPTADPDLDTPLVRKGDTFFSHTVATDEQMQGVFVTDAGHYQNRSEWHAWVEINGERKLVDLARFEFVENH